MQLRPQARRSLIAVVIAICLFPAAIARADDPPPDGNKALAAEWANKAQALFDAASYKEALEALLEAEKHARPPTFTVFQAEIHEKLGQLIEARDLYSQVAALTLSPRDPPAWKKAQEAAQKALPGLSARIPEIQVTVRGDAAGAATVRLDGLPLDPSKIGVFFPVNPGKHTISGGEGAKKAYQNIDVQERTHNYVSITLGAERATVTSQQDVTPEGTPSNSASPATGPLEVSGYVALGVSAAGLLTGAVAGGLALSGRDAAQKACGPAYEKLQCAEANAAPLHNAQTMARVSTAGLVIGGVAAAAGVTFLVLAPKREAPLRVTVTPGFVSVRGAF